MPRILGREVRGVVFDLDGVLAPTLDNHVKAYAQALEPLGVPVEYMDVAFREGQRSPEIIAWLAQHAGKPLDPDTVKAIAEEKNAMYRSFPVPPPYPDAASTLEALHARGLRVGLASGTHKKNVPHVLGPLLSRFEAVVAAEDVTRPKPHPEPYLKAADALGLDPRAVCVVENAPLGVKSGKAAGAVVVAVTTTLPEQELKEADRVVASLSEFLRLVEG